MKLAQAIEIAAKSDPGRVRADNEDAILADSSLGLAVLADGMGGYNAGEVAAGLAAGIIADELRHAFTVLPAHESVMGGKHHAVLALEEAISRGNDMIWQASRSRPEYGGMGTTVVTALFYDNTICVGHVGDSRLYRLRQGALELLTRDHSLLQEQIDNGIITPDQAKYSSSRNLVTRALGSDFSVRADINEFPALSGDIYLLCSDGLSDMLDDEKIRSIMFTFPGSLDELADRLVSQANEAGGRDNVSVVLVRVLRAFPARRGVMARLERLFA